MMLMNIGFNGDGNLMILMKMLCCWWKFDDAGGDVDENAVMMVRCDGAAKICGDVA